MEKIFHDECKKLRNRLTEFWQEKKFCDLTLKTIDGKEFHVHKNVLCSLSEYFDGMLTSNDWAESKSDTIQLDKSLPSHQLEFVLEFVYTGVIQPIKLDCEKGIDLLKTAFCLSMKALKDYISLYLKEQISILNCLTLWRASVTKEDNNLETEALNYMNKNFVEFFNEQVLNLKESEILKILSLPNAEPNKEICYLNSVKWIKADMENRKAVAESILKKISFNLFSNDFKVKYVLNEKSLYQNEYFVSMITKEFSSKLEIEKEVYTPFRYAAVNPYLITSEDLNQVDIKNNKIIKLFDAKRPRGFSVTKFEENKIIVSGGENTNKCECIFNNKSFSLPPMKENRMYHSSIFHKNKLYCCGGENKNTVEIFDFQAMKWFDGPPMLRSSSKFTMIEEYGVLYGNGMKMDLRLNKWQEHKQLSYCDNCRQYTQSHYTIQNSRNCAFINVLAKFITLDYKVFAWTNKGCGIVNFTNFNIIRCVKYSRSFTNVEAFGFENNLYFFGRTSNNEFYTMKYDQVNNAMGPATSIKWNNIDLDYFYIR